MSTRSVIQTIVAQDTRDGAGVSLRRSLGSTASNRLDPFLMLDEFYSDRPQDYMAGFPSHPHRGFETITYMLAGSMQHRDHLGNEGNLGPGDVQWMTAGRGVIHSEMPQQEEGLMRGFQLWLNLPGAEKMQAASYRDIAAAQLPLYAGEGFTVKQIAGTLSLPDEGLCCRGYINGLDGRSLSTDPIYADISLSGSAQLQLALPERHNAAIYVYEGQVDIAGTVVEAGSAAVLSPGEQLSLGAQSAAKLLVIAGRPIGEPVAQYGPFVMNSPAEIEQALRDYRDGSLTD